jgi:hypothetical protein
MYIPPPPASIAQEEQTDLGDLPYQTDQQAAASRAGRPLCASCHQNFDPYGLVLDAYDNVARFITVDSFGLPVDPHTALPPELGSGSAQNVFDMAEKLAASPLFTNCMAKTVLQYALTDLDSSPVSLPSAPNDSPYVAGCATQDVARRFASTPTQTFGDMVHAALTAPAFSLRAPDP